MSLHVMPLQRLTVLLLCKMWFLVILSVAFGAVSADLDHSKFFSVLFLFSMYLMMAYLK